METMRYKLVSAFYRPLDCKSLSPSKNVHFDSNSKKVKKIAAGIHREFQGLKFDPDPRGIGYVFHRTGREIGDKKHFANVSNCVICCVLFIRKDIIDPKF